MKTRESASRHLIIHTARAMAKKEGWSAVSVRKIADQMQYTAPIIYEFFDNREDLIAQVLVDGFHTLRTLINKRWADSDQKSLVSVSLDFWSYALKNPEIYEAMNLFASMKTTHQDLSSETQAFCKDVSRIISEWAQNYSLKSVDTVEAADMLWAQLHGIVSLGLNDQLGSKKRVEELITKSVLFFEEGLKA